MNEKHVLNKCTKFGTSSCLSRKEGGTAGRDPNPGEFDHPEAAWASEQCTPNLDSKPVGVVKVNKWL